MEIIDFGLAIIACVALAILAVILAFITAAWAAQVFFGQIWTWDKLFATIIPGETMMRNEENHIAPQPPLEFEEEEDDYVLSSSDTIVEEMSFVPEEDKKKERKDDDTGLDTEPIEF
jgi:hypothetical protein